MITRSGSLALGAYLSDVPRVDPHICGDHIQLVSPAPSLSESPESGFSAGSGLRTSGRARTQVSSELHCGSAHY